MEATTYKSTRAEIKRVNENEGSVDAVLSTSAIDRDGEDISQDGWDLKDFLKHPVLVSSHDYGGGFFGAGAGLTKQIGEWKDVQVKNGKLMGTAVYYVGKGNQEADWGFELAKMGRAAYSVGFLPVEWENHEEGDGIKTSRRTYTKQRLLEASHVIIPSNPQALARMKAKGIHPVVRELVDESIKDIPEEDIPATFSQAEKQLIMETMEGLQSLMEKTTLEGFAFRSSTVITAPDPDTTDAAPKTVLEPIPWRQAINS